METNSADVIPSPGTPLDRGAGWARPGAPDSARSVTELFTEHHLGLVRLAVLMVGDLATAEDVVQDAFEQLHHRWRSLRQLLDTDAPGDNLADSRMIVSRKAVSGTIQSALITPDGREVLMSTFRYVSSGGHRGTVIVQIVEVSAVGGPVRVLRTQAARYIPVTQYELSDTSQVLSLDPSGRYALVQGFQFGWLDLGLGRFTPFAAILVPGPRLRCLVSDGLLAGGAVDALPQQVGVAQVTGVLLDHVQVDRAQRHQLAVVGERVVQGRVGHGRVG